MIDDSNGIIHLKGGIDPAENLVWFRPEQIGVCNWPFLYSAEVEDPYQLSMPEADPANRRAMFNRMGHLMEQSGSFVFICFDPCLALHDANLMPVILADGHADPIAFTKA